MNSPLLTLASSGGSGGGGATGLQFNEYADASSATVSVNIGDYQADRVVIMMAIIETSSDYANVMNMDGGTTEVSATAFIASSGTVGPIFAVSDRGAFSGKTSINVNVTTNGGAAVTAIGVASYTYYGGTATPDITEILQSESVFSSGRSVAMSSPEPDFIFCFATADRSSIAFTAPTGATQQAVYTNLSGSYNRSQHIEDPTSSDLTQTVTQSPAGGLAIYGAKFNLK